MGGWSWQWYGRRRRRERRRRAYPCIFENEYARTQRIILTPHDKRAIGTEVLAGNIGALDICRGDVPSIGRLAVKGEITPRERIVEGRRSSVRKLLKETSESDESRQREHDEISRFGEGNMDTSRRLER